MRLRAAALSLALVAPGAACRAAPPVEPATTAEASRSIAVEIVAEHPHDPEAFTQGLVWDGRYLLESTGLEGRSTLREVELASGRVVRRRDLAPDLFGEGLALVADRLVQLTWKNEKVLSWNRADFAAAGEQALAGEGWGLAWDGRSLVESDGSPFLVWRSPATLAEERRLLVRRGGRPLAYLNELEVADGEIFANVWMTDEIVRIDPRSGDVTATYDASGLLTAAERDQADVLNGIAWDPTKRVFYITGKLWPKLFEVRLPDPPVKR
ncbi:MAG: glutaminyl-peptide cyclotransferase [Thermoanaerobaculia bacterium]